jgi:spore maturation protein CgeB
MHKSVVIIGTSITSAYLSGATTLFRALSHAFINRGCKVIFIEMYNPRLGAHTDYHDKDQSLRVLQYSDRTTLDRLLSDEQLFAGVGLVLKFSGSSILHDRYLDEWLTNRRTHGNGSFVLVYVDADAPMRLPYIMEHSRFYLHASIRHFDIVWVMLGGQRAVNEYFALGAKRALYLPVAIDAHTFRPDKIEPKYLTDLLFIGNPAHGRRNSLEQLFLSVARECSTMQFVLAGAEWDSVPLPDNIRYLGYVPSAELALLYSNARLVLNITRREMAIYGDAAALRLFEAAACGACIVSDYWPGLERLFLPGEEILIVHGGADVKRYLETIDRQRAGIIGKSARARVLRDHTADSRIDELISLLQVNL